MAQCRFTGLGAPVDGLETHQAYQPPDAFPVDSVVLALQPGGYLASPVKRRYQVLAVDQLHKVVVKEIARFSFLNYFSNLLWLAPGLVLPIMVVNLLGAEQNVYFYIAWMLGGILGSIPQATSLSLLAEGSNNRETLTSNVQRSVKIILVLLLPAIVIILLLGDKLLFLFGQTYSQYGTGLLCLMALAALSISVNALYISIKRVKKICRGYCC